MPESPPDPVYVMRGHTDSVTAIHFPRDQQIGCQKHVFLSASASGEICLWNLLTLRIFKKWSAHDGKGILWLSDINNQIISQGRDGQVLFWTEEEVSGDWKIINKIPISDTGFCQCSLLDTLLACPIDSQGKVNIIDLACNETISSVSPTLDSRCGMCMCLKLVSFLDQPHLLCGYESGKIVFWNVKSALKISELNVHENPVMCLDFDSHQRQSGISGSSDKELKLWTLTHNGELTLKKTISLTNASTTSIAIRPDKKIVCASGYDGRIRVFSWKSLKQLAVLMFHEASVQCLTYSQLPVGRYSELLAGGSVDHKITLWSIYNKGEMKI